MPPLPVPPAVSRWRGRSVAGVMALIGMLLAGRLVQLQGIKQDEFERQAERQRVYREAVPPRPGDILDRRGRLLATSVVSRSLYVVPDRLREGWDVVARLAPALGMDPDALFLKIASHPDRKFLWVRRRLTNEEADRVRALDLPAGCWGFREEYLRQYPQGVLAAHVLGLRDVDGRGRGGIEEAWDAELRGQAGYREFLRDASGRIIDVAESPPQPPRPGKTVVLALDAVVQFLTERALDDLVRKHQPQSCCAVVVDPQTGEVLAMASRPTFDPNAPESASSQAWKNRTIADVYEPGSTLKPCIVAWALQQGVIRADEVFDCENGAYQMGPRVLHDHHPYGRLSLTDVLVKSSNIGMAKIGERMTNAGLFEATQVFGFGRPTGVELPGELPGIVRPPAKWDRFSTGSVPMGQEIAVTPLQIITAYSALANDGKLVVPRLVRSAAAVRGEATPVVATRLIDESIARWITQRALVEVVERGTGKRAKLAGWRVFGKTGTAQKVDAATGEYSQTRHISSFICGAPAEAPRLLVLVSVDEPTGGPDQFGGTIAAPVAATILQKSLRQLQVLPSDGTLRSALRP